MRCVASRRTLLIGMVRGGSVLAAADRLRHCRGDVEGAERGKKRAQTSVCDSDQCGDCEISDCV